MKKISKNESEQKNNLINQFFTFNNYEDDEDIEESFFDLKRNLLSFKEISKDNGSINLILQIFLFKANSSMKSGIKEMKEKKIEGIKKEILNIIKNHDTFRYFLYNNRIDEKILLKIIPHLKYEHIPKNSYFIREGDNSTQMFFILKGKVSFRKKIHNLRTENIIDNEKFTMGENSNFGYLDIIYERKRKLSSYSLENCHLIIIEKEIFKKYLEEKIVKSEAEKKSFITKFLKSHMTLASYKIDIIIQNIKTLHFRKGEIIYKEGSVNKSIYLVYKGEAKLIKQIKNGEFNLIGKLNDNIINLQKNAKKIDYLELIRNDKNENDDAINNPNYNYNMKYLKNKTKNKKSNSHLISDLLLEKQLYHDVEILGPGGLGGLEITTGELKTKYSMVSNSDYTTIFKFELKNIESHLKEFMLNLLCIFIQNEKNIHSRIKQIKYIDNNIIPLNCQKFKLKNIANNNLTISPLENDSVFIKQIQKINSKFDTNEGGFIKINNFNMELNTQKNLLKDKLKDNKIKDNRLDNILKEYDDKEKYRYKYNGVKMYHKPNMLNINDDISNYKFNKNGFLSDRTKITENENSKIKANNKFFIYSNGKEIIDLENKKLIKNMSQRDFTIKTLGIFDKVIANYRRRKEMLKLDIFSPNILRSSRERSKRGKTLDDNKKDNMLLKEVIILKNKNREINSYCNSIKKDSNKNKGMNRHFSGRNDINKKINKILMKQLNIYKSGKNKEIDDELYIVNKNFLKKLFDKNMNKYKKSNTIFNNNCNFKRNCKTKRMIYYNTGMFDMPFVSHLTLKNNKI